MDVYTDGDIVSCQCRYNFILCTLILKVHIFLKFHIITLLVIFPLSSNAEFVIEESKMYFLLIY